MKDNAHSLLFILLLLYNVALSQQQRAATSIGSRLQDWRRKESSVNSIDVKLDEHGHLAAHDPVDLSFEDISLQLNGHKTILDGSLRGRAKPGRMLAIMGPSGAGKSTLLHALAGRIKYNPKLQLYGRVYVNGQRLRAKTKLPSAFIEQEVNFFPHMTVRETLEFRVSLGIPHLKKSARDVIVNDLLEELGLTAAADTIVGGAKVRGISGGERKRLSIAVEMINSPSVIFLDEPTSGLDSTAAATLVQNLRELADAGKTVIAVIHQPSQHVFSKFDDLLLLADGKLMYFGERQNVRSYMEARGCHAPSEVGTAEHILDCISKTPMNVAESDEEAEARVARLGAAATKLAIDLGTKEDSGIKSSNGNGKHFAISSSRVRGSRANIFVQFKLLLQRSFHEVARGKLSLFIKTFQQMTTAVIYGGIYHLGTNQASIQDRFGLLSLIAIGATNLAVAQTVRAFPREKVIVSNELASRMYNTLPYFVAKALSELPLVAFFNGIFGIVVYNMTGLSKMAGKFRTFLGLLVTHGLASQSTGLAIGAFSPNSDVALAIFPAVIILNIIFDGKNISEENTPKLLRWIPKVGLIRWGFEGLCTNEFEGLKFDVQGIARGPVAKTGAEALARFGLGTRTVADVVRAQLMITGAGWLLSYLGLTLTRQKFLLMREPEN